MLVPVATATKTPPSHVTPVQVCDADNVLLEETKSGAGFDVI
jgi:hypothetical protein